MKKISKHKRLLSLLLAVTILAAVLSGCGKIESPPDNAPENDPGQEQMPPESSPEDEKMTFKPAELGVPARDIYEYPYMGLTAVLSDGILAKIRTLDVLVLTKENYISATAFSNAFLRLYALNEEQKNEEVEAFDPEVWEAGLAKIGALGAYDSDSVSRLDELTGCTEHIELGKSDDGLYTYYLSLSDEAGEELKAELEKTRVTIIPRTDVNLETGNGAFSEARGDGANVGTFTARDIGGNEITQDYFKAYDLTLVNVFTTWCTFCIDEMPELQKLSEEMADAGVGVMGVVYDTVTPKGDIAEDVIDLAKVLRERVGITFPMLIPDETGMNGRLSGINSYPESFLVDKNGNIVGEPIMGAKSFDQWKSLLEKALNDLGESQG